MYTYVYGGIFLLGIICVLYMSSRDYSKIDRTHWTLIVLLQFVYWGYFSLSMASNLDEALLANAFLYIGGTVVPAVFIVALFNSMKIHIPEIVKQLLYVFSILLLLSVGFGGRNGLYYSNAYIKITDNGTILVSQPGPFSKIHDVYIIVLIIAIVVAFIFSLSIKDKFRTLVSRGYIVIAIISSITYAIHHWANMQFEILPVIYLICIWGAAITYNLNRKYDIEGIVAKLHEKNEATQGYVAFDMNKRFLGATPKAFDLVPDVKDMVVNEAVSESKIAVAASFLEAILELEKGIDKEHYLRIDNMTCKYNVSYFSIHKNKKKMGYLIEIVDDTERQKHIEFVENYNVTLKENVKIQTEHIRSIQERVVVGLANMIENRDDNTGGHVKRTSDVVKIIIDTMRENEIGCIDDNFAMDVVRAAPMHDLGKISIDNSILCKPGKLTDEEYAIMKTHAEKSGEIVLNILDGVEGQRFVDVAYKLARHHHERWDGKGYPDGLAGEDIPLEARIMAIADVYDALVSKRCYKEAMSYEKANDVMLENMGSQFDPMFEQVFVKCREKLEEYYKKS